MPHGTLVKNALSDNELTVVRLLAAGLSTKQVASRLGIGAAAVSMRLRRAAGVLGTTTAVQTAVVCARLGLLDPDNHRVTRVRRAIAERHSSACALLRTPVCDCCSV